MQEIFLGLGTNSGIRIKNLALAREKLGFLPLKVIGLSPVYESEPWGFRSPGKFLNQVIEIDSDLQPGELLRHIKQVEQEMGRKESGIRYTDRIIDIDILFYGSEMISFSDLVIPHPLLHRRRFVLKPMSDLSPGFVHPVFDRKISNLLDECEDDNSSPEIFDPK
ncbi:MAG TPA: 2-amino-4-hydroxy-6-hydroxymethyldihydropteridine diphosphokinase [Bacteroidales bacterium]|nr:2-amino-4-hydroxy-6-hydroxymethyldihydropteridine diphosphokinase [Bacteroidales bacterium]